MHASYLELLHIKELTEVFSSFLCGVLFTIIILSIVATRMKDDKSMGNVLIAKFKRNGKKCSIRIDPQWKSSFAHAFYTIIFATMLTFTPKRNIEFYDYKKIKLVVNIFVIILIAALLYRSLAFIHPFFPKNCDGVHQ